MTETDDFGGTLESCSLCGTNLVLMHVHKSYCCPQCSTESEEKFHTTKAWYEEHVEMLNKQLKLQHDMITHLRAVLDGYEGSVIERNERIDKLTERRDGWKYKASEYLHLLLDGLRSADCAWEEYNDGHDWAGWCKAARAATGEKEGIDETD